jgi:hypothetical protein
MIMTKTALLISLVAVVSAIAAPELAQAQGSAANVAGTYRCVPEPTRCQTPTYTVSQNGQALEFKGEDGTLTAGKMTSNLTVSAGPILNANGVILPDRSIQWSNGTHWQKQ